MPPRLKGVVLLGAKRASGAYVTTSITNLLPQRPFQELCKPFSTLAINAKFFLINCVLV
jgi:hypothetical protein